jgi:S-adenosyl-L-methionine hydrolase (adenosine-forming)
MSVVITLLTDFGTADGYVGEMKGVLSTLAPDAQLIDITHDVPAQDVESGRLALARCWRRYAPGTVHLAVVDPGVGSTRRAIAVVSDGRMLVGPDNGLLSPALLIAGARAVSLPIPRTASATFHGRDVFAPAAAALARGTPLDALGTPVDDPVVRRTPEAHRRTDGSIEGQVIAIDRFGNAITNLVGRLGGVVEIDGASLPLRRSYSEVDPGAPAAIVGSTGLVEIAVREGSGAARFGLARGSRVVLRPH